MYFLDFEASSLDSGSFPIEIAWVNETGHGEHYLIYPLRNWTNWSAQSEKIHGISYATLTSNGTPAEVVARRAYTVLRGQEIYSDNRAFETYWLSLLLDIIKQPSLSVGDFDKLRGREIQRLLTLITAEPKTTEWYRQARELLDEGQNYIGQVDDREAMRLRKLHRALPDAESLWLRWHQVKEWIDQRLLQSASIKSS